MCEKCYTWLFLGFKVSFDGKMYKQVDGVAMVSPLGPILANIFVGYLKSELFLSCKSSHVYLRYVNDFFVMYVDKLESSNFLNYLNNLHKTLKFTKNKKNITIYKLVKAKNSNIYLM